MPSERGIRYVIGLDVGLKHDRTTASVCHLERDGESSRVVLDRQETWAGTRDRPVRLDNEIWLREAARSYNARIISDPWQAQHLAQRMRAAIVRIEEFPFSASSVGRLAVTLNRLLRDHQLALYEDPELLDVLANARLVETAPGAYRIDHDPDKHDDRAISLALAAQHLIARTPKQRTRMVGVDLATGLRNASRHHGSLVGRSTFGFMDYG